MILYSINMFQTKALLSARFKDGIDTLIVSFIQSPKRTWKRIAAAGEYETCLDIHRNNLTDGLGGACRGGHLKLANLMISRGANFWNWGLREACRGGHLEFVNLMISCGVDNQDWCPPGVCRGKHIELIKLMISKGASNCVYCSKSARDHLDATS